MAKSDGTVYVNTHIDTQGFGSGVKTMQKQVGGLSGAIGKLGAAITAAFAVKKLVEFGKEAIELGSDLDEVQNVVDTVFPTMSEQIDKFAKNAAETAGLSQTMAKQYAGTFGAMAKAFGYGEQESYNMATALTQLAGDVASFYNLTPDVAYTKLKSVFSGETETLKDLGIVMTQSALDSFALAEGYGKTTQAMSEQEKVALRYAFVTKQLNTASGDFVKTQDSWANQTRILSLNFNEFKANIGQALIAIFTPFLKVINMITAKMMELSARVLSFVQLITGRGSSGGGSPGEALEDIASGYGDVEDATKAAEKAQKSYTNGIDELNIASKDQGSSTSAGAGTGAGAGLSIELPIEENVDKANDELSKTEKILGKVKDRLLKLAGLFKQGFFDGLGDPTARFASIQNSINSIKKSLAGIFDEEFNQGFDSFVNTAVRSFGTIAGAMGSIGLTIATNLLGGVAGYLESEQGRIKEHFLTMFDIEGAYLEQVANFADAFAEIFEVFAGENAQQVTEDLLAIFLNPIMSISEILLQFRNDVVTLVTQPFIDSKEQIATTLDELLGNLSVFTGSVRTIITGCFDIFSQLYNQYISPFIAKMTAGLTTLLQEHILPLFEAIGNYIALVGEQLLNTWETILRPLLAWVMDEIVPEIMSHLDYILDVFLNVVGAIMDIIGYLIDDVLTGLSTFLQGVFTLDWEKAWQGIASILVGIWNIIATTIETVVNNVIKAINKLIESVNKISSTVGIPAIPKIKEIGIPRAKVPFLASGAVIPPNAPFAAVLGDQKNGMNLEAPEDLIRQIVREEAGGSKEMLDLLMQIAQNTRDTADKELMIGDREIARANIRGQQEMGYTLITEV